MAESYRGAGHLPKQREGGMPAEPEGVPRQRRGTTPQMRGRYPDYDVLEQSSHWDDATREVVLARLDPPPIRFFDDGEVPTLTAFCDTVTAQDSDPKIPVLSLVDKKLHEGKLDGFQYEDMPDDRDVWRIVARGLDEAAMELGHPSFGEAPLDDRHSICERFAAGELDGGAWNELNLTRAWSVVMRGVLQSFYQHPWAWNEIGFGGPAYPRGYAALGVDRAEHWEPGEEFDIDPVEDASARGLE
ncbi:MAG: gluconate 2-dehydrogenase subunit 3 family protein [Actinobacteria bacterium]|nr:gluconate 2-dehydrogenase subunit 3 family protein [Actinomycetota bacterium]